MMMIIIIIIIITRKMKALWGQSLEDERDDAYKQKFCHSTQ